MKNKVARSWVVFCQFYTRKNADLKSTIPLFFGKVSYAICLCLHWYPSFAAIQKTRTQMPACATGNATSHEWRKHGKNGVSVKTKMHKWTKNVFNHLTSGPVCGAFCNTAQSCSIHKTTQIVVGLQQAGPSGTILFACHRRLSRLKLLKLHCANQFAWQ